MSSFDIILIVLFSLYAFMILIKYLSLQKKNMKYELVQKHKPKKNEIIDILNLKSPTIITGEVEDWFIFNKNDIIDKEKLNNKTISENSNNLVYVSPIVRKYNINSYQNNHFTNILNESNTRHFLVLLQGELEINLYNPQQREFIQKNNQIYTKNANKDVKFITVKLYAEQILYIPYHWFYSFKCKSDCLVLDINSETILTLPIKMFLDIKNK